MNGKDIHAGDVLLLKSDNPYGITDLEVKVDHLKFNAGYSTPWVMDDQGRAFRPSDFKCPTIATANARISSSAMRVRNYS